MSAMIYGLPRSLRLESWAAALFMEESCKSAPGAGSSSALEDEEGGKGWGRRGKVLRVRGSSEPCLLVWHVMTPESHLVHFLAFQW